MSTNLRNFTEAVYAFDAVVARMPDDGWTGRSGCPEWDGRQLVEHQCAVLRGVTAIARTGEMATPEPPNNVDDPVAVWRTTRDELLSSLDQPGALHHEGPYWFRAPTVDDLIGIVAWDPFTHAWDLAQCAGLDPALNPALAEAIMATIEPLVPMLVKSERIQEPVSVPDTAPAVDRYLAMVGRTP